MLGYSEEELLVQVFEDVTQADDGGNGKLELERLLAGETDQFEREKRYIHKNGKPIWVWLNVSAVRDADGQIVQLLAQAQDITKRKEAESRLTQEHALLTALTEGTTDAIYVKDVQGRYIMLNSAATRFLDRPVNEIMGYTDRELFTTDVAEQLMAADREVINANEVLTFAPESPLPDSSVVWLPLKGPVYDDVGNIIGTFGISRDISASVRAEEETRNAQSRLASHVEHTPLAIIEYDENFAVRGWSSRAEAIFGWTAEDVRGKHPSEWPFVHEEDRAYVMQRIQGIHSGERKSQITVNRNYHKNGSTVHCEWYASTIYDESGNVVSVLSFAHDVTDRVEAEKALELAHQRLEYHVGNTPLAFVEWDSDFKIRRWSTHAEQLFGWTPDELNGMHADEWQFVHRDDNERTADAMNRLLDGEYISFVNENRNYTKDGRTRHCVWYNSALRDESGKLVSIMSLVHDVTERVAAEEQLRDLNTELETRVQERTGELSQAQSELLRSTRLATLGQLTATVSHELRNPLSTMRTSLFLLDRQVETRDAKMQENFERLERNIRRCDRIIDELLDFTRISEIDKRPIDLDNWLDELLADMTVPPDIEILRKSGLAGRVVDFDPDRLRRAIINIYDNACDAAAEVQSAAARLEVGTRKRGARVEIWITDTGPGMTPEVLADAFEPLRSTKAFGIGLGLPTVKQILEQHGGAVELHTDLGVGTQVTLSLPIT